MNHQQEPRKEWESFWARGASASAAMTGEGAVAFLDKWWRQAIAAVANDARGRRAADLGSGAGALAMIARDCLKERQAPVSDLICIDYSACAVAAAAARLGASPLVADLAALPIADGSIDLVLSQYGIEYAGDAGIAEAARIIAPKGALLALLHDREGALAAECRENLALFDAIASTRAFDLARDVFRLGFAMDRGAASGEAFRGASAGLQAALSPYDDIIRRENRTIAMAFLRQIRRDLAIMLNRRRAYAVEDVARWLDNISTELAQSRGRYAAMLRAARAGDDLNALTSILAARGFETAPVSRVMTPAGASIGWRLLVRRR